VPLAYFNGAVWEDPGKYTSSIISAGMENCFLWLDTGSSKRISIGSPVTIERFAEPPGVAFITNYCPRITATNIYPYPKVGIVLNQSISFNKTKRIDSTDKSWRKILDLLTITFNRKEFGNRIDSQAIARKHTRINVSLNKNVLPINDSEHLYYYELVKYYPEPECYSISKYEGWLLEGVNGLSILKEELSDGDCDGKGLSPTVRPTGSIFINNRLFIVSEIIPYEGEAWSILELKKDSIIDVTPLSQN